MMIWMDVDTALASVPVNVVALIDSTDFKTIEAAVAFNAAGMALFWNFTTTAGVTTSTAVTPTTGGLHDWTDFGTSGFYAIGIPTASGDVNNTVEGFGRFSGVADGVLPWIGPVVGFRSAALNNALVDGNANLQVDLIEIMGSTLTEGAGGRLKAAFVKLFDVATPVLVASDAQRGTNNALLASTFTTMFAGMTAIAHWFGMIAGKQAANATALTELKATGAGSGTYDPTTDSTEAIRDTAPMGSTMVGTNAAALAITLGTADTADIAGDIAAVKALLPSSLVGGRMSSDVGSISASTAAADKFEEMMKGGVNSTAKAGTLSATQMSTNLTESTDDHYVGRIVTWTSGVLLGQSSDITDYVGVNGVLTFTAVTDTPSATDAFVIT